MSLFGHISKMTNFNNFHSTLKKETETQTQSHVSFSVFEQLQILSVSDPEPFRICVLSRKERNQLIIYFCIVRLLFIFGVVILVDVG